MDKESILGPQDLFVSGIYLIIIIIVGLIIRNMHKDDPAYKWFMPNLLFKLSFGIIFVVTYFVILGYGGDSLAYWDGAVKLNNLFYDSPVKYFKEMVSTPSRELWAVNFNTNTGYPPRFIYEKPPNFYVSKVFSIFSFFTFKSYTALTLIAAFIAALSSFRLYQLVRKFNFTTERYIIIATMFIPTVAFWCSSISKDMIILACFYFILYYFFAILDKERKFGLGNIVWIFIFAWILYHVRSFMLIAIMPPMLLGFGLGYTKNIKIEILSYLYRGGVFIVSIGVLILIFSGAAFDNELADEYLDELVVKQKDFATNETYGEHRYDLGITDYSPSGLISAAPASILAALYRPFLWESQGVLMYVSGLESLILMVLTLGLFVTRGGILKTGGFIIRNEFLTFALSFILFFGFFVGFSSGLFNVLIRFKAPILAFFVLVLAANPKLSKGG